MKDLLTFFAAALILVSCLDREYLDWNNPVNVEEGFSHDMIVPGGVARGDPVIQLPGGVGVPGGAVLAEG